MANSRCGTGGKGLPCCQPLRTGVGLRAAFPVASGTPVRAGDVLACAPGEDLRISSSPSQGNALLFDHEFAG